MWLNARRDNMDYDDLFKLIITNSKMTKNSHQQVKKDKVGKNYLALKQLIVASVVKKKVFKL